MAPVHDRPDGVENICHCALLQHVAFHIQVHRGVEQVRLFVHRQDDDFRLPALLSQLPRHRQAVHARHIDVEDA